MNVNNINILLRNNTGSKDKGSLIEGFVIRLKTFKNLFSEIKNSQQNKPEQNYLLIGQRGSGKTTLIYRIKYAIEDDLELNKWLIPIILPEEQYNIIDLENLWESIAEHLEENNGWNGILKEVHEENQSGRYYEENIYEIIEKWLKKKDKRLILFVENLNVLFKKINDHGQKRLREILITSKYLRVVGTSISFFDGIIDYSKPFYDFFKIIELESLNKQETETLLLKIGEQYNEYDEIKHIIRDNPKRIESLRRLTGGVPRTISYLFQIFMDNENGKAIKDLYQLVDHLTLLYKAELDQLSPQQQKIVDVIAKKWDPISVKEIVQKTRFDSKHISSILNQLEKNQLVEILPTNKKNHLYRIRERFLNIWYLMRFGKKTDREKVIWLVRFFDVWCDKTELAKRISVYLDNLKKGSYDNSAALDLGITFLSCQKIPDDLRFDVYETTKAVLPKKLVESLTLSDIELGKSIREFVRKNNFEKAFNILSEVQDKKSFYLMRSWLFIKTNKIREASSDLEMLYEIEKKSGVALQIGEINEYDIKDFGKAVKYYKLALEGNEFNAAHRLGHVYFEQYSNLETSTSYYRIAIENGITKALTCLAGTFVKAKKYKEAEIYFLEAVEKNVKGALNKLGIFYGNRGKYEAAESTLKKAFEGGDNNALVNLGILNLKKKKKDKLAAKKFFELAIEKDIAGAYFYLGKFYLQQEKNEKEAERLLLIACEKGNKEAKHSLAHFYTDKGDYEKSEKLFLEAFSDGLNYALFCLAYSITYHKRNDKKEFLLKLLEDHLDIVHESIEGSILYSQVLLWNNRIQDSIDNLLNKSNLITYLEGSDEKSLGRAIEDLTTFFIFLMAKGQFKVVYKLFESHDVINFKEILKPVYYAFMNYKNSEYFDSNLKPGDELKETVKEIIEAIDEFQASYN